MRRIPLRLWSLAVLSGVIQVLSFPIAGPVPFWRAAVCWIAITPLLLALTDEKTSPAGKERERLPLRIRDGAALGYCSGFIWYLGNCYWVYATMHTYGGIAKPAAVGILVLFCLYLGLYNALFGCLITALPRTRLTRNSILLLSPFVWVAAELARARITGFPWDLLGIAQVDNPLLIRLAPFTGAYGISFVIAAVNALWLMRLSIKDRRYTRPALTLAGVCIIVLYVLFLKTLQIPTTAGTSGFATLVQENLEVGAVASSAGPALTKTEMLQVFSGLSMFPPPAIACYGIPELPSTRCGTPRPDEQNQTRYLAHTDLIVWPEAPNSFFEGDLEFRTAMTRLAHTADASVIVGNIGLEPDRSVARGYQLYNSAEFIQPDGSFAGRYDKMHLVPFGEYVPYKNLFFFAGSLLADVGEFEPGTHRSIFKTGGHSYGTFICYESIFGDEIRHFEQQGAEVLVNISDDGWYGDTSAAWEHLNMVRMRAIENRRWILRATNTGVTASIDPNGRVVMAAPRHVRTSIRAPFNYEHDVTFYAANGDLFAYLCALVTTCAFGWSLAQRKV